MEPGYREITTLGEYPTILGDSLPHETSEHASQEPPSDKPYHAKRPHKKSRSGCKNCKARKVKCDEARPVCRSCRLRKSECVYPNLPSSVSGSSSSKASPVSPSGSTASDATTYGSPGSHALVSRRQSPSTNNGLVARAPTFCPAGIDAVDLKLLWFYTTATSGSFSVDIGGPSLVEEILKVKMVQVAFEIPFLMDSIFALSSLHLQSLDQNCDPSRALFYRARSFEGYRRAVEEARPETFPALIANSLFLTALSSQVFREDDTKELYIIDWLIVWKGIGLMVDLMGVESVFKSGLAELFYRPAIELEPASADIPNHLLFMISTIKSGDPDFPFVEIYYTTLQYLGSLYCNLREGLGPIMSLRIITWFTFIPRDFVQLARERRPRALVIIAHYVAFIKIIQSVWWVQGIADRSLDDLSNYLGPEWHSLITVPRMVRDAQGELDVARTILEDPDWVPPPPTVYLKSEKPIALVNNAGKRVQWTPRNHELVGLGTKNPLDETTYFDT